LGWIANFFLILAAWLLGYKKRYAFLLVALGEFLWIIEARDRGLDMVFLCAVFCILALRNWWKWRPEGQAKMICLVEDLEPGQKVVVHTRSGSVYTIEPMGDDTVSIQGGKIFPGPRLAELTEIKVGNRMVLRYHGEGHRLITTPVVKILCG
jgi:hypothetical protein